MKHFPGRASLEIVQKIQKDLQYRNIEPEEFEDRIPFMSMFNDIRMDKERTRRKLYFKFRKGQDVCEEVGSREDTGDSLALETNRSGMEVAMIHMKENGVPSPLRWWNDSKIQVTLLSRVPVL